MSNALAFHLRKQVNALQRLSILRPYTTEATKTPPTPEQQTAFLRAQDQQALQQTQDKLNDLRDHVNNYAEQLLRSAEPISGPAIWDPQDSKKISARERRQDRYPTHLPPYQLGFRRQQAQETPKFRQRVMAKAKWISEHLTDLRYEPYPEHVEGNSKIAAWDAEMAKMSRAELQEQLFELQIGKEPAAKERSKGDGAKLLESVKQIDAWTRSGKGKVDLDAPERVANPFQQREAAGQRDEEKGGSTTAAWDGGGMAREGDGAAKPVPTASLNDLQKMLEASMKR